MPADPHLLARLRDALSTRRDVEEKKMFSGVGLMVDGKLCVAVGPARAMFRIDPDDHDALVARGGCETVVMRGREMRGWIYVPADALGTKRTFDRWLRLALDYNPRATASAKPKAARPAARRRSR